MPLPFQLIRFLANLLQPRGKFRAAVMAGVRSLSCEAGRSCRWGSLITIAQPSDTISTSRRGKSPYMVWVCVVTTAFVVATFIIVRLRGYKKMPHALRDAIAADAIFGALLLVHALL